MMYSSWNDILLKQLLSPEEPDSSKGVNKEVMSFFVEKKSTCSVHE